MLMVHVHQEPQKARRRIRTEAALDGLVVGMSHCREEGLEADFCWYCHDVFIVNQSEGRVLAGEQRCWRATRQRGLEEG